MPLFSTADRGFLDALSRLAYANPFLPDRIEIERAALGDDFRPEASHVWSRRSDIEENRQNVERLAARATRVVDEARGKLAAGKRADAHELVLYEDAALYILYDRFRAELQTAAAPTSAGIASTKITIWPKFKQTFDSYFTLPELRLPSDYDPAHILAGFFQIRRAFHHIFDFIVGQSMPAARLRASVWQSSFTHDLRRYHRSMYKHMSDISTLVSGPSGTGKELVARAVGLSRYIPFDAKKQCFVDDFQGSFQALNLSALSPTLIESDLFGHSKGSFTGAVVERTGWLEQCKPHGTVFLDEIGELDAAIQVKLLRVVQSRAFSRLGESEPRRFEGKIIAATNRDLAAEMHAGRFREDLYYRLCSDLITTTPLCEHLADAPEDLHDLLLFICLRTAGDDAEELAREVERWIEANLGRDYRWPGNIRELEQCVRNYLVRGEYRPHQPVIPPADDSRAWLRNAESGNLTADDLLGHYCRWVYAKLGTYERTAERLGLDRRTVSKKIAGEKD